ncbi:hypothetical protein LguiB_006623 [Lonicera macranthoides]
MADIVAAGAGVVTAAATVWEAHNAAEKDKSKPLKDLETIHADLNEAMILLCLKRDDHEDMLKRFSARKRRTKTYSSWIDGVGKIEVEVDEINQKYEQQKCRKSKINFKLDKGSELGREMEIKTEAVRRLYKVGMQLTDILVEKEPEPIVKMKAPDITEFSTLQKPMEDILAFLSNDKVKGIRVRGLVGVGKTAIMQNLNNHEKLAEVFNLVLWVNVSTDKDKENLSTGQLQLALVRRLKLNVEGCTDINEVACAIREELRDKKYLLLLDDVKEDLELDQIGIDLNDENGSKVVLTTTVDGVCNSIVDRVIEVKKLTLGEAWKMFKNVVSQNSNRKVDQRIERIMYQIVKYCGGLPLVIRTVANAFKMRDSVQSWSDGLNSLRLWPEKQDDAMKALYKLLNFCSGQLKGAQKDCFFHSAIYPEDSDIDIDCLLDCWAAEDLYGEVDDAKQVRAYGPQVLEDLKKVSLLEECVSKKYVRMHKLIRRAALFNLSANGTEHKHLVKTGESLLEPPIAEHWEEKRWISLVDNELQTLPESPDCSILSTLFLQKNPCLRIIPSLFFEHMENLRVLNMDSTRIVSLPSSLAKLIRLKVLCLNGCTELVLLPSEIGELQNIEVIDMRGSGVEKIPEEFKNLQLRRLLVSFSNFGCRNDTKIVLRNCNLISEISSLEELIIDVKSYKHLCNEMQNVVIDKIAATLTKLTTFKFCFEGGVEDDVIKLVAGIPTFSFPRINVLMSFVKRIDTLGSMSKPFQVFIGCSPSTPPQIPNFFQYDRYLRYCNGSGSTSTILKVLAETEAFELVNHPELEYVSNFGNANLHKVRGCLIEGCNQIRAIADKVDSPLLPNLEELYIKMLPLLISIWKVLPVPHGSLYKLRTLKIEKCSQMEELLVEPGNNATVYRDFLPNLESLVLADMPNLRRICAYGSLEWPALEKLQINGCPNLKELPFNKYVAKMLHSIQAEQSWWDALKWQDPEVKERLEPVCSLG